MRIFTPNLEAGPKQRLALAVQSRKGHVFYSFRSASTGNGVCGRVGRNYGYNEGTDPIRRLNGRIHRGVRPFIRSNMDELDIARFLTVAPDFF
jgi:hypothetical protein